MKRSPPSSHPSPSTSCSSSSCVTDDHPTTDRLLKQSKRPRKCATSKQCRAKGAPVGSISDSNQIKFNRRSSTYRGVTRHRWTGRFEAHLWDKSSYNSIQNKKGTQVYLGAYDSEEDAARTYDLAALKYWGLETILNFPRENYAKELEEMQNLSKQDYLASLRRHSSGFSRGVSKYRGVAKHHHNGRWEARIGRVFGNKYLYLGTFSSQEEAAKAYDLAAIQYRGRNAVTNFDISNYIPKEQPQHEENPSNSVEIKPAQVQNEEQEHLLPVSAALAQTSEESELIDTFNHSPILLADGLDCSHEQKDDDPWSFSLDAGGYDPLLVPHVFQDEEDSNLLNLHLFHGKEEDSSLFDLHVFHNEEDSYTFNPHVFCHKEDSNLFDLQVFHDEESNLFDPHLFCNEEDSNLSNLLVFPDEEEGGDSNLFDVLNEKAFEDDINLIFDDGTLECLDGVKKGRCEMEGNIDTLCFDSSSSYPSSSSTVTCDLF